MAIKGSLRGSIPVEKRFSAENRNSRQNRAQKWQFSRIRGF